MNLITFLVVFNLFTHTYNEKPESGISIEIKIDTCILANSMYNEIKFVVTNNSDKDYWLKCSSLFGYGWITDEHNEIIQDKMKTEPLLKLPADYVYVKQHSTVDIKIIDGFTVKYDLEPDKTYIFHIIYYNLRKKKKTKTKTLMGPITAKPCEFRICDSEQ